MTAEFFPEQTIRYKTHVKRTLIDALTKVFQSHPDELLQHTRATIEYPRTEVDYPAIVLRFFERQVFNAGVGHQETVFFEGESDSIEVAATVTTAGTVQLSWPAVANATAYKVYVGTVSDQENHSFRITDTSFHDSGQGGTPEAVPTVVTAQLATPRPSVVVAPGPLPPGPRLYRVTAIAPSQAITFQHYFYTADVEFAIYALSALDRDLVADALVQTITMGTLDEYTNQFYEEIYPTTDLFPDSQLHFININSDQMQGFGENSSQTPWGSEDDLLYTTSYRVGIFGELYSLPPKLSYAMVQKVIVYPYIEGFPPPLPAEGAGTGWITNYVQ